MGWIDAGSLETFVVEGYAIWKFTVENEPGPAVSWKDAITLTEVSIAGLLFATLPKPAASSEYANVRKEAVEVIVFGCPRSGLVHDKV